MVALVNRLLCPGVAVASLVLCVLVYGHAVSGYYLALCVLVFLLSSRLLVDVDVFTPSTVQVLANASRTVIVGWAGVVGIVLFLGYAAGMDDHFHDQVILSWITVTPLLILASVKIARVALLRVSSARTAGRAAVIVGANYLGRVFAAQIRENPHLGVHVTGFFDDRSPERIGVSNGLIGKLADVPGYVKAHGVHCVYISLPMTAQLRVLRLMQELCDTTASVYFIPDYFAFDLIQAGFDNLAGMPVVAIRETPLYGLNAVVKRAMDLTLSAAVVALTSPVMLAIAIAIKLDSTGPVLFRQRRYGMDGSELVVLKFRTMRVCEDGDRIVQARPDDPRVTPLGAFLRRNSLDELPQFFNVLRGNMSVVGPRPHAIAHNEQYRRLIPGYMLRHKVRPGITGWAQINGFRGETRTVEEMRERVELDLDYLNNWSPLLDLWIIIRTFLSGWRSGRAY
jgi:putative colanic acid biosynthesis UDP-glucose lipid carrier transferase